MQKYSLFHKCIMPRKSFHAVGWVSMRDSCWKIFSLFIICGINQIAYKALTQQLYAILSYLFPFETGLKDGPRLFQHIVRTWLLYR